MEIHHFKHHKTYVTNFNDAMEQYANAEARGDYAAMIALQVVFFTFSTLHLNLLFIYVFFFIILTHHSKPALKFNGGGHVNHSIFWTNLSPKVRE